MKNKILLGCTMAAMLASCGKKETPTPEATVTPEAPAPAPKPVEIPHTKVSESFEGKTMVLEGDTFVAKDVNKKTEYFLVYFSASW